jgi:hypothetical protein
MSASARDELRGLGEEHVLVTTDANAKAALTA